MKHRRLSLTPKQITLLLNAVQDGDLRILVPGDANPDLEVGPRFEDQDVYLAPAPPTPAAPRVTRPCDGRDLLLACLVLRLVGVSPDRVRDLSLEAGPREVAAHWPALRGAQ